MGATIMEVTWANSMGMDIAEGWSLGDWYGVKETNTDVLVPIKVGLYGDQYGVKETNTDVGVTITGKLNEVDIAEG